MEFEFDFDDKILVFLGVLGVRYDDPFIANANPIQASIPNIPRVGRIIVRNIELQKVLWGGRLGVT